MLHNALLLVLSSFLVLTYSADHSGFAVWRVQASEDDKLDHVMRLAELYELTDWAELNRPERYVDIMVTPEKQESFRRSLRDAKIEYSHMIPDVERLIKRQINKRKRRDTTDNEIDVFDYKVFNTYSNIMKELRRIAAENPDKVKLISIGKTYEGREIPLLRITHNITDEIKKPIILIDSAIHAREWVSLSTNMWLIQELMGKDTDPAVTAFLDSFDFVFMPVLNPDGYAFTWESNRLWRKNRRPVGQGCIGVDLNRNWDYEWGGEGASSDPCKIDYAGPSPFSENETTAFKDWMSDKKDRVVLYINFHSYGQLWMTPYGYSTNTPDNEQEMMYYSKIAVEEIVKYRGTTYRYGPVYTTIYPASSISVDWIRGAENIQIAFTVELPDKGLHGFLTPASEIEPIGEETWLGLKKVILEIAHNQRLLRTNEIIIL